MNLVAIENLLKRTMGLDAASVGSSVIEQAVQRRLLACGATDAEAYLLRLQTSEAELQMLIEAVVVPETWFFRNPEAFLALAHLVNEKWRGAHPDGILRVLSLPCSTGEEPYSLAMTLLDAGLEANRFRIDALDISARALEHAQSAVYGRNSFRGSELGHHWRHFEAKDQRFQVLAAVRCQVRFVWGNFFDEGLLSGTGLYDVIFCRNVLIYFDRATQDRAVRVLSRLLDDKGFLFVGPSESSLLLSHGFGSLKRKLAFAFRKPGAARHDDRTKATPPVKLLRGAATAAPRAATPPRASSSLSDAAVGGPPTTENRVEAAGSLEQAARLADNGQLTEAAKHCEIHLARNGPSAQAYYLLGLMRDASGHSVEATTLYRKALYLDPAHAEALVHLALLLEGLGDTTSAGALRSRARRLGR